MQNDFDKRIEQAGQASGWLACFSPGDFTFSPQCKTLWKGGKDEVYTFVRPASGEKITSGFLIGGSKLYFIRDFAYCRSGKD